MDGISIKNNRTDFIPVKNTILDVTFFDYYKWIISKEYLVCSNLREGKSWIFSTNPADIKEKNYSYDDERIISQVLNTLSKIDQSSQEKIKEELNTNFESFLITYCQIISTEKTTSDNEKENFIINDTVRGTFIKQTSCLQLTKNEDNSLCYDHRNRVYYILSNRSMVTQSILVANTFENYYGSLREKIVNQSKTKNEEDILNELLNSNTFEEFFNSLVTVLLLVQTKKPDLLWKYRNWNYYYNYLFEKIFNVSLIIIYYI